MSDKKTLTAHPFIYNITLKIHEDLVSGWLEAMKNSYLPACTDGRVVVSSQINKILISQEDEDLTFAVQFIFATSEIFEQEGMTSLGKFIGLLDAEYRGRYVYFTTKMEILHSLTIPSEN